MLLPKDLISGRYIRPDVYLCETDKERICKLETFEMSGSFKFNSYSTLNFNVGRFYNDAMTGATRVNPYYNKIEAVRLVELAGFGFFELQDPEITGDGIKEVKSVTANSSEYTLTQKYLQKLYVNTGEVDSVEVMYAEENKKSSIIPVVFYDPDNPKLSLLHIILEKVYGWKIGHVDQSLWKMSRKFEVDRESVYDFIMNEICEKFNCYAVFDTIENTISFYAEALTNKFTGDGSTVTFMLNPIFSEIGSVSVDGYKTISYSYNALTGELTLDNTPEYGAMIEVTDGALSSWETDVFVTFDNLAQEMNISYTADDIKTVLNVYGADELGIREVNMGLPYIVDLSYFYTVDWMGQELYDAYTAYLTKCNQYQAEYKENSQKVLELSGKIWYESNRLSLQYSEAPVSSVTVGTYYVRGGDADSGYYYTEVSLPSDYNAETTYYSIHGSNLNEDEVANLYDALKTYYYEKELTGFTDESSTLQDDFSFMENTTIDDLITTLGSENISDEDKDVVVSNFFDEMWEQIGLTPLKTMYLEPYKVVQTTNVSAGWAEEGHENYGLYYPVVLILASIEKAIAAREKAIEGLTDDMTTCSNKNIAIGEDLLIENNFTEKQLIRLNAFLREDEYTDDNFVATGNETTEELFKLKQELLECGRIEASKLSSPCLKFSMSLANIYALPEFEPIMNQFQLGNLIKVALRPDYIKHTRLMQVDLSFDDFSDFSCEFGDLTSIRSQSDLHADLLSKAVSAGKTVASNASYWNKGADQANSIDVRLEQGLLNATTAIKSIDGNQHAYMDNYGIHLEVINPETGELDDKRVWLVNNQIVFTDDGFKTSKSVLGEFTVDGQTYYGLLAQAVIAGYIEGSKIKGGTIQIGERDDGNYNFEVDSEGVVTFYGGKSTSSNGTIVDLDDYNTTVELTASSTVFTSSEQSITLTCNVYSYGVDVTDDYKRQHVFTWTRSTGDVEADNSWNGSHSNTSSINTLDISINDIEDVAFFQCTVNDKSSNSIAITTNTTDVNIYTSKPETPLVDGFCYTAGDLWVVGADYQPNGYVQNVVLVCINNNTEYSDADWDDSVYYSKNFKELDEWQGEMQEHVQIQSDGLHLIGPASQGVHFESVLQSDQLTFMSVQGGTQTDVIWLGVEDMTAKNITALNHVSIQSDPNFNETHPYLQLGDFKFQIEENGSLSLV